MKKDLIIVIFAGFILFVWGFIFDRYEFLISPDRYPVRCSNL